MKQNFDKDKGKKKSTGNTKQAKIPPTFFRPKAKWSGVQGRGFGDGGEGLERKACRNIP